MHSVQILSYSFGLILRCGSMHHLWSHQFEPLLDGLFIIIIALNIGSSVLISEQLERSQLLFLVT